MTIILLGIIIGLVVLLAWKTTGEDGEGEVCEADLESEDSKKGRLEKILELLQGSSASAQGFGETREVSNVEIRRALGVSERSVVRYMDELEKEGKVEQIGDTGRGVEYRLKRPL